MKIFTNRDIRNFFLGISCVSGGFIVLILFALRLVYGAFHPVILLLFLLFFLLLLLICVLYFRKQNQILEDAVVQINSFLLGDTDARIACEREGSLYKMFHAFNTLTTTLETNASKELQTKEFLKDTISDISHQLKTPLTALTIYNAFLQDESGDKTSVQEFAQKSEKEIERIEVLVENLLKITRLDAGTIVMEKHREKIAGIMFEISKYFETRAETQQKSIVLSGSEDAELFCDKIWMTEALSNIVKNAFDHCGAGDQIAISWEMLATVVQITIKDDGSGIHPEDIYHIFKRFYRSRFSKDTKGIGLGLPLAKAIVEAHEGNITVDSHLGEGTVFVMSFPNLTKL